MQTILEYQITTFANDTCISKIQSWIEADEKARYFVCANPHSFESAANDIIFKHAIKNADLIVPDGIGIVIASKLLGGNIQTRITGTDIFLGLSKELNKSNKFSVFFLGSTEENLAKIKKKMKHDFPNIKISGTFSPPFKHEFNDEDNNLMIDAINQAKPDVLWVGMTAPKQEKWIYQNKDRLNVKFIGPIGAVFDFYTGNVKRSHPFFQNIGLEWLPRLLKQPQRLYSRTLISAPRFFIRILKQKYMEKSVCS